MKVSEVIKTLDKIKNQHGDVEVYKLRRWDYLSPVFEKSIVYNPKNHIIEI